MDRVRGRELDFNAARKWFSEAGEERSFLLFAQLALCPDRVSDHQRGEASWTYRKTDYLQHPPASRAKM